MLRLASALQFHFALSAKPRIEPRLVPVFDTKALDKTIVQ